MAPSPVELKLFEARGKLNKLRIKQAGDRSEGVYYNLLAEHFSVASMKSLETDEQKMRFTEILNAKIAELEALDNKE